MCIASGIAMPGIVSISPPSLLAQRMRVTVSGRSGGIGAPGERERVGPLPDHVGARVDVLGVGGGLPRFGAQTIDLGAQRSRQRIAALSAALARSRGRAGRRRLRAGGAAEDGERDARSRATTSNQSASAPSICAASSSTFQGSSPTKRRMPTVVVMWYAKTWVPSIAITRPVRCAA